MVAHQWLEDGQWRSLTYRQVYDQVRDAALGLAAIGLRPGEFAVVWSGNRSEATICDYAVMHAGAVPVFIYPTVSADQGAVHRRATARRRWRSWSGSTWTSSSRSGASCRSSARSSSSTPRPTPGSATGPAPSTAGRRSRA